MVVKAALGNPRDIRLLDALRRAREPRIRSDAVEALVNLSTKRFIQPLVPLLKQIRYRGRRFFTAPNLGRVFRGSAARAVRKATADDPGPPAGRPADPGQGSGDRGRRRRSNA
ncbi:MAG: hypothetical protein U1E33_05835 [Rhodospirillales bacterium]